jgi:hypothetical protein
MKTGTKDRLIGNVVKRRITGRHQRPRTSEAQMGVGGSELCKQGFDLDRFPVVIVQVALRAMEGALDSGNPQRTGTETGTLGENLQGEGGEFRLATGRIVANPVVIAVERFLSSDLYANASQHQSRCEQILSKEAGHHRPLHFDPAFGPTGFSIRAIAVPRMRKDQIHHARCGYRKPPHKKFGRYR